MPNVRASSGTIGTTRFPMALSRISAASIRTITIVVEAARSPEPWKNSANASDEGGSMVALRIRRCGSGPPRTRRRSFM